MVYDIDKAIKETERKVLELNVEKEVEEGQLKPYYRKLKERGYGHDEVIGIIADMFETLTI